MNERIKLLAEQAGITTNLDTDFYEKDPNKWVDYFSKKFAELIVRECTTIMHEDTSPNCPYVDYFKVTNKIKQHFGVEE